MLRNHLSEVVYTATKKDILSVDALTAETLGLRWSLQVAHQQHLTKVLVELDAKMVIDYFNGKLPQASINHFIVDCK